MAYQHTSQTLPWWGYRHHFDKPWLFPTKDAEQVRAPLSPSESDPLPFLDPVKKAWILAAATNNVGQTKLTPCTNDAKIDIWRKKNIETFKQFSSQNWKTGTFTSNISSIHHHHQCGKVIISTQGKQSPPHQGGKLRELLQKDPFLLTVADPYSGYTAVHWAAKVRWLLLLYC